MRKYMNIIENNNKELLPENVIKAFDEVALSQSGEPEQVMVKLQKIIGGGVLNPVIEHTGDLTHRMTEKIHFFKGNFDIVDKKVEKVLNILNSSYGFEREMKENFKSNANLRKVDIDDFTSRVDKGLTLYAKAHSKITVYNEAQYNAREAAVSIGKQKYNRTVLYLENLKKHLKSKEEWENYSMQFELDNNNNIKPYKA